MSGKLVVILLSYHPSHSIFRTLRITSVDGRETRLDDNPSQELRRQFGELQKRVRALNNHTRFVEVIFFRFKISKAQKVGPFANPADYPFYIMFV